MSEDAVREEAEARVGQVLREKWRLDQLLGVGGMAAVYAATHRNGKRGAVKLLHHELSRHADSKARFLREGYVANAVKHPGAVSVLDDDVTEDGSVFLVMELLEGSTVDALAGTRPLGRMEVEEVLAIADGLLDVLAVAHEKGIVHRDLKPENLFMTGDGVVHVLDFGIARLRQGSESVTATRTGASMGTPAFMPPEQALGEWDSVDARTDLWAVGATMFTLLTGQFVHDAATVQKMMLAAMTRDAPPLVSIMPELPADVASVVDRALARRPEDRYPDARSMQLDVRACRIEAHPHAEARASSLTLPSGLDARAAHGASRLAMSVTPNPQTLSVPASVVGSAAPASPLRMTADPVSSEREAAAQATAKGRKGARLAIAAGMLGTLAFAAVAAIAWMLTRPALPGAAGNTPRETGDARATETATRASAAIAVVAPDASASTTASHVASGSVSAGLSAPSVSASAPLKASTRDRRVSSPPVALPPVALPPASPPRAVFTSRHQ